MTEWLHSAHSCCLTSAHTPSPHTRVCIHQKRVCVWVGTNVCVCVCVCQSKTWAEETHSVKGRGKDGYQCEWDQRIQVSHWSTEASTAHSASQFTSALLFSQHPINVDLPISLYLFLTNGLPSPALTQYCLLPGSSGLVRRAGDVSMRSLTQQAKLLATIQPLEVERWSQTDAQHLFVDWCNCRTAESTTTSLSLSLSLKIKFNSRGFIGMGNMC